MLIIKQEEVLLTGGSLLLVSENSTPESSKLCMLAQVTGDVYKLITLYDGNRYFEDSFNGGPIALERIRDRNPSYCFTPVYSATLTYS